MSAATVVSAADVPAALTASGASVRTLFDPGSGGPADRPGLARRLVDVPPRAGFAGTAGGAGELWFVIGGSGRLAVTGQPGLRLSRDHGAWIPPGARYQLSADPAADLRLDAVTLPAGTGQKASPAAVLLRDLGDCPVETTGDRRFRVLFGPARDCAIATQFVGEIPPGRAPDHSHPYDEVVLVLEGTGVVHVGEVGHPLAPGTCTHLPPGQLHCLENTGGGIMRVLGVFHPADSPAAKLPPGR
jgi:mannose-6-phosphate isomerase-like protein (cupin superfamily)